MTNFTFHMFDKICGNLTMKKYNDFFKKVYEVILPLNLELIVC